MRCLSGYRFENGIVCASHCFLMRMGLRQSFSATFKLYRREKTGRGGGVQSSLLQNGLWANACFVQSRLYGEPVPHRPPRAQAPNALANHYRCRDGRWFIMALFNEPRQWPGFLAAIGRPDLADDPRFATSACAQGAR